MSKYREFWLEISPMLERKIYEEMPRDVFPHNRIVHVIEYSAYETLTAKVKLLEDELQEQCRINGMGAQRELALMTKVKRYETALKEIEDLEPINERQRRTIARAALNQTSEEELSGNSR